MKIKNPDLLRGLLRETGQTYRQLEGAFGIHNSHLSNVLAGRRPLSREAAERMCDYLGVDVRRVFAESASVDLSVPSTSIPDDSSSSVA